MARICSYGFMGSIGLVSLILACVRAKDDGWSVWGFQRNLQAVSFVDLNEPATGDARVHAA